MRRILFSLAISCIFLATACRLPDRHLAVPIAERPIEAERGSAHAARDKTARPQAEGQIDTGTVTSEPPDASRLPREQNDALLPGRSLRLRPPFTDRAQDARGTDVSDDRRQVFRMPMEHELSVLPFGMAVVSSSPEFGVGVLRRRLETVARLGPAMILLPPHVKLNKDEQFVFDDVSVGFGPAEIEAQVVLWPEPGSDLGTEFGILVDNEAGTILLMDTRALDDAAEVRRSVDQLLRARGNGQGSLVLVTDRPVWITAPVLWAELKSLLAGHERIVVLAFSRMGQLREEQRDGIRCVVVPHHFARKETGTVWLSQGRGEPDVGILHSEAISDIQRINPRIREQRDRLVKSLTVTPVCGGQSETTVRFRNTLDTPLNVQADWRFGNGEVPVNPEILGFQLAAGEKFSQIFQFQNENERPLKFLRPRFVLSMSVPDGVGGESPLVVQAAPVCCMRGTAQLVDDNVVLDGDPSEWAGRGYPLNHESQVINGLDAWRGPADLSANLFVSRTSDAVLIGAHVYDDQHADPDQESRAALAIAVDLLSDQNTKSGIGVSPVQPDPADQNPKSGIGVSPVQPDPITNQNPAEHADGRGRLELRFSKQTGIRTVPELEGVRARWSENAEALSIEVRIPVALFAGGSLGPRLRVDAALTEPHDDENPRVCLVFSGRDPELRDTDLFGIFRVPAAEVDNE